MTKHVSPAKRLISVLVLAALLLFPAQAMAESITIPHVNKIRVNKFHLQLVDRQYWFAQNGEWDWANYPLSLQWEYSDGKTDSIALPETQSGSAHILCDIAKLESLAQEGNDQAIKFSIVYTKDGQRITLASDYPFLASAYYSIALNFRIWYADGALWYAGGKASQAPSQLIKTFPDGTTQPLPLPSAPENGSVRLLSPSQVEKDLSGSTVGWVEYSLQ